jgi:hypothetical protein
LVVGLTAFMAKKSKDLGRNPHALCHIGLFYQDILDLFKNAQSTLRQAQRGLR